MSLINGTNFFIGPIFCERNESVNGTGIKRVSSYPTFQKKMAPSEPPLQKSSSWNGCHERQDASFLCPRKVCSSWSNRRMSNSLIKWSLEAVMSHWPFLFHFASITVLLCACSVARDWPDFGSHSFTGCWLSLLPDMTRPFCGCQSTHLTSAPCPSKVIDWHHVIFSSKNIIQYLEEFFLPGIAQNPRFVLSRHQSTRPVSDPLD